jgi:hypothetical protein
LNRQDHTESGPVPLSMSRVPMSNNGYPKRVGAVLPAVVGEDNYYYPHSFLFRGIPAPLLPSACGCARCRLRVVVDGQALKSRCTALTFLNIVGSPTPPAPDPR